MHSLPSELEASIGTSTLFAAWNAATYVGQIDEQRLEEAMKSVDYLSITKEVLKEYAINYGVTNPNWHFMTGNKEVIYNLANAGFNLYAAEVEGAAGGFEHSGNFALIDKEGYIRSRTDAFGNPKIYYKGIISQAEQFDEDGESEDITALKEDILKLLGDE